MNQKCYTVIFGECVTVFDVWPDHFLPVNQRNSGVQAKVVISKSINPGRGRNGIFVSNVTHIQKKKTKKKTYKGVVCFQNTDEINTKKLPRNRCMGKSVDLLTNVRTCQVITVIHKLPHPLQRAFRGVGFTGHKISLLIRHLNCARDSLSDTLSVWISQNSCVYPTIVSWLLQNYIWDINFH